MSQETADYLLLFRGTGPKKDSSPEEMQSFMNQWMTWWEGLSEAGKVKGGHPLEASGNIVSGPGGSSVTDGPFAESKEAIGGFFHLTVSGLDEATEIAKATPGLEYGGSVEVRAIADCCPKMKEAEESQKGEPAAAGV